MPPQIRQIVGFDFGHGESAACITETNATGDPDPIKLFSERSIITAVGESADGQIVVGDHVSRPGVSNVKLRFKSRRFNEPEFADPTKRFVKRIVAHLVDEKNWVQDIEQALFVVGCPSRWHKENDIPLYEKLFRESGMRHVKVIKESRAAFLSTQERDEAGRESRISYGELGGNVLVIDIGSSTTDFTFVSNYEAKLDDFGQPEGEPDLGASLIEVEMLADAIKVSPSSGKIEILLKSDASSRAHAEIAVRKRKEEF